MIYDVSHTTRYDYDAPVPYSKHVLHLLPRGTPNQFVQRSALSISPVPVQAETERDYFGNTVTHAAIQEEHTRLSILARSVVEVNGPLMPEPDTTLPWERVGALAERDRSPEGLAIAEQCFPSPRTRAGPEVEAYARVSFEAERPVLDAAIDLIGRIYEDFSYDPAATSVSTPVDEAFALRRGVCQDFAHLAIACFRGLGLPARYVSGYILTHPPPGQEKLRGADASHAWVSLWCPGFGWADLDPTNNKVAGEEHITVAWGRDYGDVSPIAGAFYGANGHAVAVSVDVRPRPTAN